MTRMNALNELTLTLRTEGVLSIKTDRGINTCIIAWNGSGSGYGAIHIGCIDVAFHVEGSTPYVIALKIVDLCKGNIKSMEWKNGV